MMLTVAALDYCGHLLFLRFVGVGDGQSERDWFYAARFRKITPPEADAFDREVIEAMRPAKVTA